MDTNLIEPTFFYKTYKSSFLNHFHDRDWLGLIYALAK